MRAASVFTAVLIRVLWDSALKLGLAISSVKGSGQPREADTSNLVRFVISSFRDAAQRIPLRTQIPQREWGTLKDELGTAVAQCQTTKQSNGIAQPGVKNTKGDSISGYARAKRLVSY
jgi:hypothetical protein